MTQETGFLRHFQACNARDMEKFAPFYVGTRRLGWIKKKIAALLPGEMDFFVPHKDGLALARQLDNFDARSKALAAAAAFVSEKRERKLRKEMYPVLEKWGDQPLAQLDRAAVPWFGIKGYGVHVNGFVRKKGGIHLWIGERAKDREISPGKLDNLIGGGQPIGLTLEENLAKEAKEEADLGSEYVKLMKPAGTINYMLEKQGGLRNDGLFVYDLELPESVIPRNTDGEVEKFDLLPVAEVAALVRDTDRFKFNCNVVIIDFLTRHDLLPKDKEHADVQAALKKARGEAG